ncbi:hypothetical protein HaLaN_03517, partial [Haematococcus lacustris]
AGSSASQGQGVPWPGLRASARQATQGPAAAAACCGTVVCASHLSCHQLTLSACFVMPNLCIALSQGSGNAWFTVSVFDCNEGSRLRVKVLEQDMRQAGEGMSDIVHEGSTGPVATSHSHRA